MNKTKEKYIKKYQEAIVSCYKECGLKTTSKIFNIDKSLVLYYKKKFKKSNQQTIKYGSGGIRNIKLTSVKKSQVLELLKKKKYFFSIKNIKKKLKKNLKINLSYSCLRNFVKKKYSFKKPNIVQRNKFFTSNVFDYIAHAELFYNLTENQINKLYFADESHFESLFNYKRKIWTKWVRFILQIKKIK